MTITRDAATDEMTTDDETFVMPVGSRILHIGPHKTGTTQLQNAFHASRESLVRQRLHYAGSNTQPMSHVLSLLARENGSPPAGAPATDGPWRNLIAEVEHADADRVVVSSEFFADAGDRALHAVVAELGGPTVQVLVTLRPLARILPSQWQQFVQGGLEAPYDTWLENTLSRRKPQLSPIFWRRHDHNRLIARWAGAVGPDRVTVVVADDTDHDRLHRDVERLLALEPDTLAARLEHSNRSLTLPEIEVIRQFNEQFFAAGLSKTLYQQAMRFGAARYLQRRTLGDNLPRLTTPQWALERAGQLGAKMADGIRAQGVRVIGDLDSLGQVPAGGRPDGEPLEIVVDPAIGAATAMGVLYASGLPELFDEADAATVEGVRALPTKHLTSTVQRRLAESRQAAGRGLTGMLRWQAGRVRRKVRGY